MLHLDNSELWCFAGEPPTYIQGKELQDPQCPKTFSIVYTFSPEFCRFLWNSFKHFGPAHLQNSWSTMSLQTDPRPPTRLAIEPGAASRQSWPWWLLDVLGLSERTKLSLSLWRDLLTDIDLRRFFVFSSARTARSAKRWTNKTEGWFMPCFCTRFVKALDSHRV